jgi:hypothetical protein
MATALAEINVQRKKDVRPVIVVKKHDISGRDRTSASSSHVNGSSASLSDKDSNLSKDLPWCEDVKTERTEALEGGALGELDTDSVLTHQEHRTVDKLYAEMHEQTNRQDATMAPPGDETEVLTRDGDGVNGTLTYERTSTKGISPPDDDLKEPLAQSYDIDVVSQLWSDSVASSSEETILANAPEDTEGNVSQLWGESSDKNEPQKPESNAKVEYDVWRSDPLPESKEMVVEERDDDEKADPLTKGILTFEDFTRQADDILQAERAELLETQAILNAPPGANSLDVPKMVEPSPLMAANTTDPNDDLGVLEMDLPVDSTDQTLLESMNDQTIERELNAGSSTLSEGVVETL